MRFFKSCDLADTITLCVYAIFAQREIISIRTKVALTSLEKRVNEMIARYNRDEYTLESIAQELNNFGFRTVKGKLFNRSTVWYLIKRQKEINLA